MTMATGSVRAARLTDRQALVDLSRRVHASGDAHRRSLGVPAPSAHRPQISLASLIPTWLPLRPPSVHLVAESDGQLVGSCRAIEEPHREDWVITELDAADGPMASEIRWSLLEALIEEGQKKSIARYHAACSDVRENLELFGQAGFMAYAQEEILYLPPIAEGGARGWLRRLTARDGRTRRDARVQRDGNLDHAEPGKRAEQQDDSSGAVEPQPIQAAGAPDAWHLFDLWSHATPPAIARLEGYSAADWESVGHEATVPRSSLNPLLHFSEVGAWFMPLDQRAGGFAQYGACREGPHYLRFLVRDGTDGAAFLKSTLRSVSHDALVAGILAPVRTYESTGMRAATAVGFVPIGRVTMLVREVRAMVREPALVPAIH
ncbi:MAG TPA: hypothetical protein VKU35_03420 [Candidatus Limnocylindria bacterium]|nr:hypothetical protein [Candidatus Limnocylindria bacterium]